MKIACQMMGDFLGFRTVRFDFLGELKQGSNLAESEYAPAFRLAGLNRNPFSRLSPFSLKGNPSSFLVTGLFSNGSVSE